jgi:glycosyltransferase involved in cell wall biosynthesis
MGKSSGYDILFHELSQRTKSNSVWREDQPIKSRMKRILMDMVRSKWVKATRFYTNSSLVAEAKTLGKALTGQYNLLHVTYLENNLGLIVNGKIKSNFPNLKVVATIHQPFSWWKLNANPSIVETLDALVVLSKAEVQHFEPFLPGRTFYIPHGVDTSFFQPGEDMGSTEFRCIIVGQWLRDIPLMIKVIKKVISKDHSILFDIVLPQSIATQYPELIQISRLHQVNFHFNIPDLSLAKLYQKANLLFLPVMDATANNALLEGMASGLPIISTDVEGLKSYANETFASMLSSLDDEGIVQEILKFKTNPNEAKNRGQLARKYAEMHFNWSLIADETIAIYEQILNNTRNK